MDDDAVRLQRAKQLRLDQTDAEARLWYHLRAHRFLGLKFKRQKPVGPYIVDFICLEHGLAIEVDGGQHNEDQAYDQRRSRYLAAEGLRVLRFWNDEVLRDTDAVLEQIRLVIESEAPSPLTPLPQAGEGNA
ncbi:MAG: endonuclease domain-containing protein [Pseudomonadota bacterium]